MVTILPDNTIVSGDFGTAIETTCRTCMRKFYHKFNETECYHCACTHGFVYTTEGVYEWGRTSNFSK